MKALGGRVMTRTCEGCNNKLGSMSEAALSSLVAGEVVVEAESKSDAGPRGARRATAAIRQVPFNPPTLHVTSGDPDLLNALASGVPFNVRYRLLDPFPAGVAILKYAYLAACIWLQEIPHSEEAKSFREALIAVRDGNELAEGVRAAIGQRVQSLVLVDCANHDVGSIALVEPTGAEQAWAFVLGGRLAVPWLFTEVLPTHRRNRPTPPPIHSAAR